MKRLFFVIANLFWMQAFAQTNAYHPFPESGGVWRVNWGEQSCFSSSLPQANYRYIMNGDTLVNSVWYHKIEREFGSSLGCGPFYPQGGGYMGGLREDSLAKQIYFVAKDSLNEILLYDFSLTVGDTVPRFLFDLYFSPDVVITDVDSMLIGSDYRKVFNTANNFIVEGFGSLAGLLEVQRLDVTPQLICYSENNVDLYRYFPGADCDLISQIDDHLNENFNIEIFPNPAYSFFTLRVESKAVFVLYNLLGAEVKRFSCTEGPNIFSRDELSAGIYLFEVADLNHSKRGRLVFN